MKRFLKKEEVGRLAEMLLDLAQKTGRNASVSFTKDYTGKLCVEVMVPGDSDPFRYEKAYLMPEPSRAEDVVEDILSEEKQEA